jgi:hypothetical protein
LSRWCYRFEKEHFISRAHHLRSNPVFESFLLSDAGRHGTPRTPARSPHHRDRDGLLPRPWAAEGGPPPQGPRIDPQRITTYTAAAVALIFDELREQWMVVSGNGEVYAEATNPGDLAD